MQNIKKHKNLLPHTKMGKEILMFADIEIEKNKFSCHESCISLEGIDIEKVLVISI